MARNSVGWDWRYLGFPTKRAVFVRLDRVLYGVFAGYRRFECMVPEIVGLSAPHALLGRCHHVIFRRFTQRRGVNTPSRIL